jgi:mono/diheme cytochrome c family protein
MKSLAAQAGVLSLALLFSTAPLTTARQSQTTIKKAPIQKTSAGSGKEMFDTYCAVCHGKDAKGHGPAVPAFKLPPPDLTTLTRRHEGKFPTEYVATVLQSGIPEEEAHGSKDMPIWGPLLSSISGGVGSPEVKLRIHNLSQYLESLQAK